MSHELSTRLQTQLATTDPDHLELARRANDAHRHVVGAARAAVKYAQSGDSSDTEFAEMIRHALIPASDRLDQRFRPRPY